MATSKITVTLQDEHVEEIRALIAALSDAAGANLAALDGPDATAVGLLLARTGTTDVVDAHVAVCARRTGPAVVTSDPSGLKRLAPELTLVVL